MLHASVLILSFNLLKRKQALDRLFQPIDMASWLSVGWGLSSVITPAGKQHPAELKALPGCRDDAGPSQAALRPNTVPPTEPPAPASWSPPSRCWLKSSRLLAPHSRARGKRTFWIIIMLLRCHLQHKTASLAMPLTSERSPPSLSVSLFLVKMKVTRNGFIFGHLSINNNN